MHIKNETSKLGTNYYPNVTSVRDRPGVLKHVIVAGVRGGGALKLLTTLWYYCYKMTGICYSNLSVPVAMLHPPYSTDEHVCRAGYTAAEKKRNNHALVDDITGSGDQQEVSFINTTA